MTTSLDAAPAAERPASRGQPVLDSQELRRIAEAVSGYRGEPQYWLVLRQGADGSLEHRIRREDPGYLPDAVVIPCRTPKAAARPPVEHAMVQAEGGPPINLLHLHMEDDDGDFAHAADAVFWGESAVEKFVVPYYASVYGNDAGEAVTQLLNSYNGIAVGNPKAEGVEVPRATTVYGLVHIPRSEYIEIGDDPTAQGGVVARHERFAVLAYDQRTGEHRVVMVEEFRKRGSGS